MFDVLNNWAGAGIGEIMICYICLGCWASLSAIDIKRSGLFPNWLAWWWLSGLGVLYGTTEWIGLPASAAINANAGMLAMAGMVIAGVILLRAPSTSASDST